MKLKFNGFLVLLLALVAQLTFAQERAVSGNVSDNAGMPLPGVSVLIKGTKTGTQTDFDGKFSIKAAPSQILVFSYIGMKSQEVAASSSSLNIKLSDDSVELESVVITAALGIKREKKSISYAAQDLKGSVINEGGTNNAVSALSGNVAGLQVTAPSTMGGSTRIVLRGVGSVTGENRPLIVVDGIPLDNGNYNDANTQRGAGGRDYGDASADINPDDIESVTVLKGGPAAALYGSRAGNGAILYTTKSAKKSGGKAEISFNTGITFESVNIMPTMQTSYGGGGATTLRTQVINGRTYNLANYALDESWGPKYDPNLLYLPWNAFDPEFSNDYLKEIPFVAPKNGVKSFFNTGITRNNAISFSKSTQDSGIRFSYANQRTEGIVPNSTLSKNTFSINANTKLTDRLKAEGMVTYTHTKGFNRPEQGYSDNSLAQKFFHFGQTQLDYNVLKDYKLANGNQRTWNRVAWNDARPNYSDNPYWIINENTSGDTRNRIYGNGKLTYNITPELYAVGNVYGDVYTLNIHEQVAVGSQATPSYYTSNRTVTDFNYEGRLHFDKKFDKFSINSFFGANRRSYGLSLLEGESVGGLDLRNVYNLANSSNPAKATNKEENMRTNSLYGFVSLGYDDFLFIEATDRQDWFSTVFKSVNYASITGSFIFSELTNTSWLNYGKIRGGWAQAGNATNVYNLQDYAFVGTPFQGAPRYSKPNQGGNPDLKPELKTTKEVGLELSLFDRRLGLDVTYYDVVTTDLITPIQLDPSTGYNARIYNAGKLQNKGIEATVNINPVRTQDFRWDVTWNFAKNDNKLIELIDGVNELSIANAPFQARLLAVTGQKYGQIYGTDFTYDEATGKKIVDSRGAYVPSAQKSLGSIIPKYNMGLRNNFKYKNLNFGFLIDMQEGGSYFSTTHMWGTYSGILDNTATEGLRENGIVLDGVRADGTVNQTVLPGKTWARLHYGGVDAQNVFDASYIKLREVTLGYSMPKKLIGPLADVRFSLFARNLFAWGLDWKGMDPEMASYGSGNAQGLEGGSLPSTRTYGMNLEFKF
ncbi:SusC/RagA family TonB-linked outer membrane protein [Flavobacterium hercynium]|uniref:SusC/RagA family TonB-linked outer membrane protein n=1 Tax=Flavobacterium hercynium TaxID=387094 RepID=A0A226HE32_9FLAO|nr:SusC/RagA family TonB-linked outer membrane protein [Flavobacterium hercynium]OXA92128.1 SusC/RagA family TonB-linked outer membrane protein [Flavobacterium hercynium]SMP24838.1 TonB-linked outer membrane protein, SusC/RagA family [Flavobacterium hercynium]